MHRVHAQYAERGRPRPQQCSPDRWFSTISRGPAVSRLLRPGRARSGLNLRACLNNFNRIRTARARRLCHYTWRKNV